MTWDEYEAGFNAYRNCLSEHGYELENVKVEDDLFTMAIPAEADTGDVDWTCLRYYWDDVDSEWQMAHEDTSPTAQWAKKCVELYGGSPSESYTENYEILKKMGKPLEECPL